MTQIGCEDNKKKKWKSFEVIDKMLEDLLITLPIDMN